MKHQLVLFTFGIFRAPSDDPANDGFHERNDPILELVDTAPGFVARSGYDDEPGPQSWGEQVYPRFYEEKGDGWCPETLSVWQDLESPMAFSYFGLHAEALTHGREWFRKPQWPPLALWWTEAGAYPTWSEAIIRHEHLHDHGPTTFAFNFKQPFGAAGGSQRINRDRVKAIVSQMR